MKNITNIQKFSIHDGDGIRTSVFFKGCPLKCEWCHNPETQRYEREMQFDPGKCTGCGRCASVCPKNLIELIRSNAKAAVACSSKARGPEVKKACSAGCIGCKLCTKQCEAEAIQVENNLAGIDYDKCVGCEKCMEKCPAKAIVRP